MTEKNTRKDFTRSTRLFPGETTTVSGAIAIPAGEKETLLRVEGKGQILGGIIIDITPNTSKLNQAFIDLDGAQTQGWSYEILNKWNITPPASFPIRITRYDEVVDDFVLDVRPGLTFEEYIEVLIWNRSAVIINPRVDLAYYVM